MQSCHSYKVGSTPTKHHPSISSLHQPNQSWCHVHGYLLGMRCKEQHTNWVIFSERHSLSQPRFLYGIIEASSSSTNQPRYYHPAWISKLPHTLNSIYVYVNKCKYICTQWRLLREPTTLYSPGFPLRHITSTCVAWALFRVLVCPRLCSMKDGVDVPNRGAVICALRLWGEQHQFSVASWHEEVCSRGSTQGRSGGWRIWHCGSARPKNWPPCEYLVE